MQTLSLKLTLLIILTLLLIGCALQLSSPQWATPGLTPPIEQPPTSTPTLPTSTSEATRPPKDDSGSPPQFFPTSSYIPATADFNIILGRPTTNSIAANLYSKTDLQVVIAYGTSSGAYTSQTQQTTLNAFEPATFELSNLQPNAQYFYTAIVNGTPSTEHTFHTARPSDSTFTFTIDADPHNRDPRFNGELYATTLANALNDHPDFHINLGDTFMTEKLKPQSFEEAASTFTDMRPFFGILNADAPLFLVNGNHEGELGWLLTRGRNRDLPIWSTNLRHLYYPSPFPNGFYTGGTSTDSYLNSIRDGYYAWTWGDALFVVLDPFWYTESKPKPEDQKDNWHWTLGKEQYDWLKSTLETSDAKYKFIFIHHLVGGTELDGSARGGIEFAHLWEWGGYNADGSYGFDEQRPGWGIPIHQLLIANHVSAVFHGHDHVFVKQDLDGIVYQELPQPSNAEYNNTNLAADYGYTNGVVFGSSGHLRVTVTPEQVTVDYVRAYLLQDEKAGQHNGQVDYTYILTP